MHMRASVLGGILLGMVGVQLALAAEYRVAINTSAIQGSAGAIAFDSPATPPGTAS
jgi:hypothetical protein